MDSRTLADLLIRALATEVASKGGRGVVHRFAEAIRRGDALEFESLLHSLSVQLALTEAKLQSLADEMDARVFTDSLEQEWRG